jgi:hypothetical protein
MSDKSERVFSGARRTILWERMQLGPENIERVECLKNWHKSKISVIVLTGALDTAVYGILSRRRESYVRMSKLMLVCR